MSSTGDTTVKRRSLLLVTTAGLGGISGCSAPFRAVGRLYNRRELKNALTNAESELEQAERDLEDMQAFLNQDRWGNVAGAARDSVDHMSNAIDFIDTAIAQSKSLDNDEQVQYLEDAKSKLEAIISVVNLHEKRAEAMIDGDLDSAESYSERIDENLEDLENIELPNPPSDI